MDRYWDNSSIERFFRSLNTECILSKRCDNFTQVYRTMTNYITVYYSGSGFRSYNG
ncbi:IS3 family transposase [Candidatus Enterovibrio escicola]|uniref:IS3 family transposase n=1 Tax=Candidatus Enterovibrio escicola TaxID=1927127 RepID=UPI000BE45997